MVGAGHVDFARGGRADIDRVLARSTAALVPRFSHDGGGSWVRRVDLGAVAIGETPTFRQLDQSKVRSNGGSPTKLAKPRDSGPAGAARGHNAGRVCGGSAGGFTPGWSDRVGRSGNGRRVVSVRNRRGANPHGSVPHTARRVDSPLDRHGPANGRSLCGWHGDPPTWRAAGPGWTALVSFNILPNCADSWNDPVAAADEPATDAGPLAVSQSDA